MQYWSKMQKLGEMIFVLTALLLWCFGGVYPKHGEGTLICRFGNSYHQNHGHTCRQSE